MKNPRILFISRAYPPVVGGIENQNFELFTWLSKIAEVKIIANRRGKFFLPFFLPWATLRALFLMRQYDVLLLGDGVLACVGWKVKLFSNKPVVCVLHGLDLTYKNALYQNLWVKRFLRKIDEFICVGNETLRVARAKRLAENKSVFIPNGVDTEKNLASFSQPELEEAVGESIRGRKVLLTSGRLARRKGVAWFIRNVLPRLPENIIYVVAGDGPDKENIHQAIRESGKEKQVKLLGYVPDKTRNILLNTADLFIQPNIRVEGDMEGFGISVLEAAACRLPVVASRLEGLQDAIQDGENGFLVEPENAEAFAEKILQMLSDDALRRSFGEKSRRFTIENYHWKKIAARYLVEVEKLASE